MTSYDSYERHGISSHLQLHFLFSCWSRLTWKATNKKWFTSSLSQSTQQVPVKGTLSEKKHLTTGVPQGSCHDPVLFAIYVADLFQIIEKHLPGLCWWPSSLPVIRTHSFHESNRLSHCHWKLCGRTEELADFQHANGELQQNGILDCRKYWQQLERVNYPFMWVRIRVPIQYKDVILPV